MVKVVETTSTPLCPECGRQVSSEPWARGLCPHCLIELALTEASVVAADLDDPETLPTLEYPSEKARGESPHLELTSQQILGDRYQVRSLLGRGGMGEVWRAYDLKLRVDVALKALRTELIEDTRALETLRQEVRTAREVISPNVCRVYDLEELDGQELVSMEYVDGTTLQEILRKRGPLELDEAREIATQFLAGLEAIHEASLVHRDIKPENLMITRTGRVVVMDFGIAKGLGEAKGGMVAGTPAYMSPEQARSVELDARGDLFSAGVVLAEMVEPGGLRTFEDRRRLWEGLHQESPRVSETPWSKIIAKAVAAEREERFADASALARALEEVTLRAAGDEEARPYPGLAAFQEEDARFFFGRELEVEALWKKLRRPHLLAVIGPSGAGKSSFLRAGLLPTLTDGWRAIVAKPGSRPFSNLARQLAPQLDDESEVVDRLLRFEEPEVAVELLSEWRRQEKHGLLIVDQFEELFTQNPIEVQNDFAELLGMLPLKADVHVLLSMRDDFLLHCQSFEALAPVFSEMTPLGPPTGASLRRAIVQPALKCGYRFEDESVVEEMLGEVEGERGSLPMVAFAAARLWERRDRDTGLLTREAYEQIGGVGGALAQHAEAALEKAGEDQIPVVRELFRNLVTAQGTRAARDRDELLSVFDRRGHDPSSWGHDPEFLRNSGHVPGRDRVPSPAAEILDTLIDARLLTSYEITAAEDEETSRHRIEIIHESLLTNWPRLVRWRMQDAEGAQLRDELRQAAQMWEQHDRSTDLLWTGTAFQEFQLWRDRYPGGLSAAEEAFGQAMIRHAERRRRRRRVAVAAAFVALLSVLAIVGGFWRRSVAEARRAEAAKLLALAQLRQEEDPTEALAYTTASLELADTGEARIFALRLLIEAPPALEVEGSDQGLWESSFSPDGSRLASFGISDKVRVWTAEGGSPVVLPGHEQTREGVAAHWASNELLVTGSQPVREAHVWKFPGGGRVQDIDFGAEAWWKVRDNRLFAEVIEKDAETGDRTFHLRSWPLPAGEAVELGAVDVKALGRWNWSFFDGDGSGWLYVKGEKVFRRPLPAQEGVPDQLVGSHENEIRRHFLPTEPGRLWTRDAVTSELRLWDLSSSSGEPLRVIQRPTGLEEGAALFPPDPTGRWIRNVARQASLWDLEAWPEARPLTLRRSGTSFGALSTFHPRGDWLVVSTHGYTRLTFWPLRGVRPRVVDGYSNEYFRPLAFSPDGRWLATSWPDYSIRLWPLPGSGARQVRTLALPSERGERLWRDLAFDPQGRFVVVVAYRALAYVVPLDGSPPKKLDGLPESGETRLSDVAVSPSGRRVATAFRGGAEGKVQRALWVWDLETGELRFFDLPEGSTSETGYEYGVWDLAFADDSTLYTSGEGGVRRWNLDTGTCELVLGAQPKSERGPWAAFGPDALTALVMEPLPGDDYVGPARVLDLSTGEIRAFSALASSRLRSPTLWPRTAFDASGTLAATGDPEGIVRVARLSGGEPHLLLGHEGTVTDVAISPDGRWVASAGEDNTLRLWPMPDLEQPPFHTLPHDELIAKLRSLTNIRVVRDSELAEGWKVELDPFPGWAEVPRW